MTHTDRIRQMAQEATYYADAMDGSGQMAGRIWSDVRDEHFAQLVAEDCARVADHVGRPAGTPAPDAATEAHQDAWESACADVAISIRARYSLKDE